MYVFVITSAAVEVNDIPHSLCVGDIWPSDDPVVKAHGAFFSDEPAEVKRSAPPKAKAKKVIARKSDG